MNYKKYLDLYSEQYHKGHLDWAKKNNGIYRYYANEYFDLVQPDEQDKILELGCSSGKTTRLFIERGCQVTAVDFSPDAISLASQWVAESPNRHRAEFLCSSADRIEIFKEHEFNKVTLLDFVEHVPGSVLEAIFANLSAVDFAGLIYVFTPSNLHFTEIMGSVGLIPQDRTHINLKSRRQWISFFKRNGLTVVHEERVTSHWPVLSSFESVLKNVPILGEVFTRNISLTLRLCDRTS